MIPPHEILFPPKTTVSMLRLLNCDFFVTIQFFHFSFSVILIPMPLREFAEPVHHPFRGCIMH